MAKEEDLKVSVNCCEGCRKKVLKALSIKGILRAEIHVDASKVAVVGNVDAGILLKKLSKVGKTAELILPEAARKPWPEAEGKTAKPDEQNKKKINGGGGGNSGGGAEKAKPEGKGNSGDSSKSSESNSNEQKSLGDRPVIEKRARAYCPMEAIALPVAVSAYPAPAAYCFGTGHYCFELPVHRAPATVAAAGYGNYCSDDDGIGCWIM